MDVHTVLSLVAGNKLRRHVEFRRALRSRPRPSLELQNKALSDPQDRTFLARRYARAYTEALSTTRELDLGNLGLEHRNMQDLAVCLRDCRCLQNLRLRGSNIGVAGIQAIVESLPMLGELRCMDLSANPIGPSGANAMANALPICRALFELRVSLCHLGDDGITALAATLPRCRQLEVLDVSSNEIRELGAAAIARILAALGAPGCQQLRTLTMDHNCIGDEGAVAIASALVEAPQLRRLLLDVNSIADRGAAAFAEVLRHPAIRLAALTLVGNSVSDAGARSFAYTIPRAATLSTLALGGNRIGQREGAALEAAWLAARKPPMRLPDAGSPIACGLFL